MNWTERAEHLKALAVRIRVLVHLGKADKNRLLEAEKLEAASIYWTERAEAGI